VASSGEYYRLAVLPRGHRALERLPTSDEVTELLINPCEQSNPKDVAKALVAELVVSARSPAQQEEQRLKAMKKAEEEETESKRGLVTHALWPVNKGRDQADIMDDLERKLSDIVEDAGDPKPNCHTPMTGLKPITKYIHNPIPTGRSNLSGAPPFLSQNPHAMRP
jgi:hypothetical protein